MSNSLSYNPYIAGNPVGDSPAFIVAEYWTDVVAEIKQDIVALEEIMQQGLYLGATAYASL